MDSFVYWCKKEKMKVWNEVTFPELVAAIIQNLLQVEGAQQSLEKTYADIQTML